MALTDKLTAIADAIRGKTGGTDKLTLDQMPAEIAGIEAGGGGEVSSEQLTAMRIMSRLETGVLNIENLGIDQLEKYFAYGNDHITALYWSKAVQTLDIRASAFAECTALETVDFPNAVYWHYNSVFSGCTSLKNVNIPNYSGRLNSDTFKNCTSLENIDMQGVTEFNQSVFRGCSSLKSADFPLLTGSTGNYAFLGCASLASVNLPLVTSVAQSAFENCTALTELDLPSVTAVLASSFKGCTNLTAIVLRSETLCSLSSINAFANTPFASGGTGGTVYVPEALIESYQTATNWSTLYAAGTCNFVAIEGSEYE